MDEQALRRALDELSPFPLVDVLIAVVVHDGVDPLYLLTGEYDSDSHRNILDADPHVVADAVREHARRLYLPMVARPTPEPHRAVPDAELL